MEVFTNLEFPNYLIKKYLCAGIHLTSNAYVATYLMKDLTATEYRGKLDLGMRKTFRNQRRKLNMMLMKQFYNRKVGADFLKVYCKNIYKD